MSSFAFVRRGTSVGSGRGFTQGMSGVGISRGTFESIEQFIADNNASIEKMHVGIDMLARTMVLTIKGFAQMMSGGPIAPRHRSVPALANRIPVQRITGAYFAGWTQRKLGNGHWIVYNEAVEAYLIEYGLYQKTRRPILKTSVLKMFTFIQGTRTADRMLDWVLQPSRTRLQMTAGDLPNRGLANPSVAGPRGVLP